MAKALIDLGSSPNRGDGDPLRIAFQKINNNFNELYDGELFLSTMPNKSIIPSESEVYSIGNLESQWAEVYVSDAVYINDSIIEVDESGRLNVNGIPITELDINASVYADDSTLLVDAVNGIIPGYVSIAQLQEIVDQSADFDDFKARVASL